MKKKICVFCSSSNAVSDDLKKQATLLGQTIASKGHTLVYGGATGGLMDAVAGGASEMKGEIVGVIPEIIIHSKRLSLLPTQLIATADMGERKKRMKQEADVFLVLPGAYGTLDEMFDVVASGSVGEHRKLLICINLNGFYDKLIALVDEMRTLGLLPKELVYKPVFVNSIDECFDWIEKA